MIIKNDLIIDDGVIICSKTSKKYTVNSFDKAMKAFNKLCPIPGFLLNRNDITDKSVPTHITDHIWVEGGALCASIKPYIDLNNFNITPKPIIRVPLHFSNGTLKIISIDRIDIELT